EVARQYQPVAMTKEFRKNLLKEVDFRKELNNLEQVGANLGEDARIRIPKPFREHSSARVLTMERFDGYSVGQVDRMEAEGVDRRKLAITFADAYVRMILRDGVYHADPHPGNVLVLSGDTLGLLDFGMVGRIDERTRDEYQGILLAAMFGGDAEETTDYILRICYLPRDLDRDVLRADVGEFMSEYLGQDLADLEIGPIAGSANEIMLRHKIVMPAGLSLLFKVLAQVEGTAQLMDLSFSMMEVLEPYYREHMKERLTPQRLFQRTRRQLQDWDRFLDALPRELLDMLVRARQGDLDLTLEHRSLDGIVNRLVLGVLGAALFLGSVQLWKLRVPPIWNDVPIPAMVGLLGSLYLGIRLLRAIKKTGDLGQRR
ncbi:MAG: AarF/UbiB family protein, partial [Polyangiales bacterium]